MAESEGFGCSRDGNFPTSPELPQIRDFEEFDRILSRGATFHLNLPAAIPVHR